MRRETVSPLSLINPVSLRQKALMIKQLALMLGSGLPLVQTLSMASQQSDNPYLKDRLREIAHEVEAGHSLSSAAARFPAIFDPVMTAVMRSGEASGRMQEVLSDLASELEQEVVFTNKIRSVLLYPAFIILVMIVVGIIMTTVIIPRLTAIFDDFDLNLPWTTKILVTISQAIIDWWYLGLAALIGLVFALRFFLLTPKGRATYQRVVEKIPLLGNIVTGTYLVRFTRLFGMLLRSGVPITEALRLASESLGNPRYSEALKVVRDEVEQGIPVSTALGRHAIFPRPLIQMIAVGERSGKLEEVLATMEQTYEEETSHAIAVVTGLIEPIILIIVALAAGFVVLSVILPIYGLAEQV